MRKPDASLARCHTGRKGYERRPRGGRPSAFLLATLLATACLGAVGPAAAAESGRAVAPDGVSFLVNSDIGAERWTISLNVAAGDPSRIVNATGNIFYSDGSAPKFVVCQLRPDSTGSLGEPASELRFSCSGTDACRVAAVECSQQSWTLINPDVRLPAGFFLPPGGLGGLSSEVVKRSPAERPGLAPGSEGRIAAFVEQVLRRGRALLSRFGAREWPRPALAQSSPAGGTLSFDGLTYLVS